MQAHQAPPLQSHMCRAYCCRFYLCLHAGVCVVCIKSDCLASKQQPPGVAYKMISCCPCNDLLLMYGRWSDLPSVDQDTASRCARLRTQLTGDPAYQYAVEDSATQAAADPDSDGTKPTVSEVQRLRCMIDSVNGATAVQPKVSNCLCWHLYMVCCQWTCSTVKEGDKREAVHG